ncbi:MAG: DUF2318 domain-containing protein [Desulfobulbaceae bacterium]|nr:DUF2318 domain-containing protein [Desulfobulbaceae bacterium]
MLRKFWCVILAIVLPLTMLACGTGSSSAGGSGLLTPVAGEVRIPIAKIADGKAHFYQVQGDDGTMVSFFAIKSKDGVFRAAVDACDVCYQEGKGYHQEGDFMVCENCGMKFASSSINEVKGGCNPAPLERVVTGDQLVISLKDINANAWYMKYRSK